MRVGIISREENTPKCGFELVKLADFGAVTIYKIGLVKTLKKRRFERVVKKCAKTLRSFGITVCAAEQSIAEFADYGITVKTDAKKLLRKKCADAAIAFLSEHNIDAELLISGGSYSEVVDAAIGLLHTQRRVYIRNPAYEEIADDILEETGVSICNIPGAEPAVIRLDSEEIFLQYKEITAAYSDFGFQLSDKLDEKLLQESILPLAEILEMSGFLRKTEIKVEYFSDKKFKIHKPFT